MEREWDYDTLATVRGPLTQEEVLERLGKLPGVQSVGTLYQSRDRWVLAVKEGDEYLHWFYTYKRFHKKAAPWEVLWEFEGREPGRKGPAAPAPVGRRRPKRHRSSHRPPWWHFWRR